MSYLLALLIPLIWALTIITAKWVLRDVPLLWASAIRFGILALLSLGYLFSRRALRPLRSYAGPALGGTLLYLCLLLTMLAVDRTTVAKTVFYATLYAFFIPLIKGVFLRARYQRSLLLVLGIALLGVGLLSNFSFQSLNTGDLCAALGSLCYALYVLAMERTTQHWATAELVSVQALTMGGLSGVTAALLAAPFHWPPLSPSRSVVLIATFAFWSFLTIAAYVLQAQVQRRIAAHVLGLLVMLDAPFACVLGYLLFAEAVPVTTMLGGALLMLAAGLAPWIGKELATPSVRDAAR